MKAREDNGIITITLDGRIDTNNAAETEKEIFNLIEEGEDNQAIEIDAANLEYISSAGLRVLLKIRKTLSYPLRILNVSREVYDIFETTGFTELLDVRKAMREISIEGCEQIGEGYSGKVYRIEQDMIAKVYNPGVSLERIENERKNAKTAFVNGVPTAITFDNVRCGDSYATIYELIDAVQLSRYLYDHPNEAPIYEQKYAKMIKEMHQVKMSDEFQDMKELYRKWVSDLKPLMEEKETAALNAMIDLIPDRDTFVHCDCHVGNVMIQDGELILIDMADVGRGHPIFDIGSEYFHYKSLPYSDGRETGLKAMLGFVPETNDYTDGIWDNLIKVYFQPKDEEEYRMVNTIAAVAGGLRSVLTAAKHSHMPDYQKKWILDGARASFFPKIDQFTEIMKSLDRYF